MEKNTSSLGADNVYGCGGVLEDLQISILNHGKSHDHRIKLLKVYRNAGTFCECVVRIKPFPDSNRNRR